MSSCVVVCPTDLHDSSLRSLSPFPKVTLHSPPDSDFLTPIMPTTFKAKSPLVLKNATEMEKKGKVHPIVPIFKKGAFLKNLNDKTIEDSPLSDRVKVERPSFSTSPLMSKMKNPFAHMRTSSATLEQSAVKVGTIGVSPATTPWAVYTPVHAKSEHSAIDDVNRMKMTNFTSRSRYKLSRSAELEKNKMKRKVVPQVMFPKLKESHLFDEVVVKKNDDFSNLTFALCHFDQIKNEQKTTMKITSFAEEDNNVCFMM
ncbi:hypothetical protein EIN_093610 [Entamoeba invadens IP1]|uniref:Uncharacterized protein n=1 Tax=Entamoeba invadens IP1 TaxID=370355 RepID=A0A0A1TZZ9_ENTIV|nr:hypothetical protein EIN_093610 [Entamoeba invadens IP1]ELP87204.1 hypothetical protein EIN_093610 [Entamoeba invadens IP1]|eukprot:XP_004253975.1 hypothetical protein EIN_093610 [Entamoeba invadens IP1]